MLPSTFLTASASASFWLSRLNSPPHTIAVYASRPASPTAPQHSLPGARYGLPGPVFHRQDRASLPGAQGNPKGKQNSHKLHFWRKRSPRRFAPAVFGPLDHSGRFRARLRAANGPHLAAAAAAAEEPIAAIGFEPRYARSGRHLEPLQDLSRSRIDAPQIALVAFPGAVPELAVDPGDAGDEAVGLDGAKDRAGLGIDLMDLPVRDAVPPRACLRPRRARKSPPPPGAGIVASTRPVFGSIFWMRSSAIWNRCLPSKAVPACAATSIERTRLAALPDRRRSACLRRRTRHAGRR